VKTTTKVLALGGLAAGGALFLRQKMDPRRIHSSEANGSTNRWHVVTVNRPPEEVSEDRLPDPLAELGDQIEVQVRPAPGDRGTELAARFRGPVPTGLSGAAARLTGQDPLQSVRAALREAKMLIETGEVLRPDEPPTTRRTPTNLPLELAVRRARGEGRL
jgi:hypothetical protein